MVNSITDEKIKTISELAYDLDDEIDLSADDVTDIAVDLLQLVMYAAMDENTGVTESDVEKIKSDKVKIVNSLTGFIGDADKTATFIKMKLNKISDDSE